LIGAKAAGTDTARNAGKPDFILACANLTRLGSR
jgi:hypothetical protein